MVDSFYGKYASFFSVLTDGGTILNGLRFALAMYSGKNIFISRLLRPAGRNKRYFHRWGRGGKLCTSVRNFTVMPKAPSQRELARASVTEGVRSL